MIILIGATVIALLLAFAAVPLAIAALAAWLAYKATGRR